MERHPAQLTTLLSGLLLVQTFRYVTQYVECNRGAVLNIRRLVCLGVGQCPKTPRRFGVRARPETPHSLR
jgi:hypothetical protein